jgi:hypothetical protein
MLAQVLYFSAAYIRFAVEIDMRNKSVAQVSTGSSEVVTLRESASICIESFPLNTFLCWKGTYLVTQNVGLFQGQVI